MSTSVAGDGFLKAPAVLFCLMNSWVPLTQVGSRERGTHTSPHLMGKGGSLRGTLQSHEI